MSYHQQLDRVRTDPDTAVTVVRDNDTIVVPIAAGEPPTLLHALSERREHLRGVGLAVDIEESSIVHRAYMMRLNKMVAENRDIMDIAHAKMAVSKMRKAMA